MSKVPLSKVNAGDCRENLVVGAKNIRAELKDEFKGVKFKVTTRRFNGGDSIDISWVDGPTVPMLDAIVTKYQAGSFDGMTDMYTYGAGMGEYGSAKYVQTSRQYSQAAVERAIKSLCDDWADEDEVRPVYEDYEQGRIYNFKFRRLTYFREELNSYLYTH